MPPALARADPAVLKLAPRLEPLGAPVRPSRGHLRAPALNQGTWRPHALWETGAHLSRFPPNPHPALPPAVPAQISIPSSIRGRRPLSRTSFLPPSRPTPCTIPPTALGKLARCREAPHQRAGSCHAVGANTSQTFSAPPHTLLTRTRLRAARPRVTASPPPPVAARRPRSFSLPPGGRRGTADPRTLPASSSSLPGYRPQCAASPGRSTGRTARAGGAGRTAAAALPGSSGPAGRLFIRGLGPGPGPCRSIGQFVPLQAAPGAAALCPRRAPRQRRRPHGGREPAPPGGSTFSPSFSLGSYFPCFSPVSLFCGAPWPV